MLAQVTGAEILNLLDDPELAQEAASLFFREFQDDPDPEPEELERMLNAMEHRITVIARDDGGEILAVGGLEYDGDKGEIVDVATSSDNRKQGLGRSVIGLLERIARDKGIKELSLFSFTSTRAFYDKLGYQEISPYSYTKFL